MINKFKNDFISIMFDLKWYNYLLRLVAKAIVPVPLIAMTTAQRRSDPSFHCREYANDMQKEYDENLVEFSIYFKKYLKYFDLQFKNLFNEKITNTQISRWV